MRQDWNVVRGVVVAVEASVDVVDVDAEGVDAEGVVAATSGLRQRTADSSSLLLRTHVKTRGCRPALSHRFHHRITIMVIITVVVTVVVTGMDHTDIIIIIMDTDIIIIIMDTVVVDVVLTSSLVQPLGRPIVLRSAQSDSAVAVVVMPSARVHWR